MTIETVRAFKASDGKLFESEQDAKDHEFELALAAWWRSCEFTHPADVLTAIMDERMKLLPIFKLLNGGNGIVLRPMPQAPEKDRTDGE